MFLLNKKIRTSLYLPQWGKVAATKEQTDEVYQDQCI